MKISRNKIVCILLSMIMVFGLIATISAQDTKAANTTGFYVDGTTIRDANGNEFIMRGVNHAYAWYKDEIETAIVGSANLGCNVARIVISDGGQWDKTSAEEVAMLIELCIANKVVPMLEVHDLTGYDSASDLNDTAEYWVTLKDVMKQYEKYAILNIANEWMGQWGNGQAWADAYKTAIKTIRDAGILNMIVVDAPGWGQDGPSCGQYCKQVFDSDVEKNTIFSIHMYGSAGKNAATIKSNIDGVLDDGVPVIIGEFGYKHSDGNVDEAYIMEYCTAKRVGYIGWSWKGNGGRVRYLDIAKEWDGSVLSSDWGEVLFNSDYGIKNTSIICSIFTEDGQIPENSYPDISYPEDESSSITDESTPDSSVADTPDSSVADTDESSVADEESKVDDSSADDSSKNDSASITTKPNTSGNSGGTSGGSSNNSTSGSSSTTGSDASTNTGASALAFVGLALAGVAVVVTKKNK